jgi:hypothetical protein
VADSIRAQRRTGADWGIIVVVWRRQVTGRGIRVGVRLVLRMSEDG